VNLDEMDAIIKDELAAPENAYFKREINSGTEVLIAYRKMKKMANLWSEEQELGDAMEDFVDALAPGHDLIPLVSDYTDQPYTALNIIRDWLARL